MKKTPHIQILPPELCNQIAAGEVVERPASVVKELMENALDANATNITITVEHGGQSLIRVEDNGIGIEKEELELAITRHATSKLHDIAGLSNIHSFGFRGEALPSIASVSRFRAISIVKDASEATELLVEFGKIIHTAPASLRQGTVMEVRDLFFNIPARLKFLKNPATELKRATELFLRLALVAEGVGLSFYAGSRLTHSFHASDDLHKRLENIWAPAIMEALIPLQHEAHGIKVSGYISNPRSHQPRADRMLFYVNNRAVSDKLLMRAVRQAYQGKITTRDYPQCLICLDIEPMEIDVNVHPAKSEVRFRDEKAIFSCIMRAISMALDKDAYSFSANRTKNQHDNGQNIPYDINNMHTQQNITNPQHTSYDAHEIRDKGFWGKADNTNPNSFMIEKKSSPHEGGEWQEKQYDAREYGKGQNISNAPNSDSDNQNRHFDTILETSPSLPKSTFQESQNPPLARHHVLPYTEPSPQKGILPQDFEYLGQVAKNYLIIKKDDSLLLLDQHAAHERIIYEKIVKNEVHSQNLLVPIEYPMHRTAQVRLEKILPKLQKLAFRITVKGSLCIVNAIPESLDRIQANAFLKEILTEKSDDLQRIWIHHACASAFKSGTELDRTSALDLIRTWLQCEEPDFCPHGRPCVLCLNKNDLEKMFKRKM